MVKIKISSKNRHGAQGFSLFELLIGLAILSLMVSISGFWLTTNIPNLILRSEAQQIEQDIKRARLHALMTGEATTINKKDHGYRIDKLDIDFNFHRKINVDWDIQTPVIFTPQSPTSGGSISLSTSTNSRTIRVTPLTGRVSNE